MLGKILCLLNFFGCALSENVQNSNVKYGIMVDCGSTGTRFKVYQWTSSESTTIPTIKQVSDESGKPLSLRMEPGLSSFVKLGTSDAIDGTIAYSGMRSYLMKGMEFAKKLIPVDQHHKSPFFVYATAGMRLVETTEASNIWAAVRHFVDKESPFLMTNLRYQVRTISGEEEGVFDWITSRIIDTGVVDSAENKEVGVDELKLDFPVNMMGAIDLGGASTQIAFSTLEVPLSNYFPVVFTRSTRFNIYTKSYLTWGKNQALQRHMQIQTRLLESGTTHYSDPCFWNGASFSYTIRNMTFFVQGAGNFGKCLKIIRSTLLEKETFCAIEPCGINGVFQPTMPANLTLYAYDNYYKMASLFGCSGVSNLQCIHDNAEKACDFKSFDQARTDYFGKPYVHREDILRELCFSSAYVVALAQYGLNIDPFRPIVFSDQIKGNDMDWTLGAMLYELLHLNLA